MSFSILVLNDDKHHGEVIGLPSICGSLHCLAKSLLLASYGPFLFILSLLANLKCTFFLLTCVGSFTLLIPLIKLDKCRQELG